MSSTTEQLSPEIQARLDRAAELERKELERAGEYDRATKQIEERSAREVAKREERIATLTSSLIRSAAVAAIRDAKGDVEALLPHVLPKLGIAESRSGVDIIAMDPESPGRPRESLRSGRPMTAADLVSELRDHPSIGLLFEGASLPNGFRRTSDRIIRLSAEDAKSHKLYVQLKERKAKGEIEGAVDEQGRRIL